MAIINGKVIDGTGNPWFKADVGIKDGKIAKLTRIEIKDADRYINAKDLFIVPGFVDIHSHSDKTALVHNKAENSLHMGITTMGGGNCGGTEYPITDKIREDVEARYARDRITVSWSTLAEWRICVENKGIGANLAPYIGHNTVRGCVMGKEGEGGERYEPTNDELNEMKVLVEQAMKDGAFGLSTGLAYALGRNALTQEVIELCEVVAKYGGMHISHIRDTADACIQSVMEVIEISEKTGVRGSITHHKTYYPWNFGKPTETMRIIERTRARGIDIVCDVYPYAYGGGGHLGRLFYPRGQNLTGMTREKVLNDLKDPEKWEGMKKEVRMSVEKNAIENEERTNSLNKYGIDASPRQWYLFPDIGYQIVYSKTRPDLYGKNLKEVANLLGEEDWLNAARELFLADEGHTYCGTGGYSEEDVITIMKNHTCSITTDSSQFDISKAPFSKEIEQLRWHNPRGWGTYPRVLQKYVREEKILKLEDAIRKMTSLPAQFLNLKDRGVIRESNWADIVVFDANKVEERGNWITPCVYPIGIPYVLVNGEIVIDEGEQKEALPGKVLFHEP